MLSLFRSVLFGLALVVGLPLASTLVSATSGALGLTTLAALADSVSVAQAAFIRRGSIKSIGNQNCCTSYRVIVVVGDDNVTNEVEKVEVSLAPVGIAPTPSETSITLFLKNTKSNGNRRYVYTELTFSAPAQGASYNLSATRRARAGAQVGAVFTQMVTVTPVGNNDPDVGPGVRSSSITRLDASNFELKVVVEDDAAGSITTVDVIFVDFTGSAAPIPTEVNLANPVQVGGRRIFSMDTLTFENPAGAVGQLYDVFIDLKEADGKSAGYVQLGVLVDGGSYTQLADLTLELEAALAELDAALSFIEYVGGELNGIVAEIDAAEAGTLPPSTRTRITATANFIDDWQGETAYLSIP